MKTTVKTVQVVTNGQGFNVPIDPDRDPAEPEVMLIDPNRGYVGDNFVIVSHAVRKFRDTFFPEAGPFEIIDMDLREPNRTQKRSLKFQNPPEKGELQKGPTRVVSRSLNGRTLH
jgi:hypothetical protein